MHLVGVSCSWAAPVAPFVLFVSFVISIRVISSRVIRDVRRPIRNPLRLAYSARYIAIALGRLPIHKTEPVRGKDAATVTTVGIMKLVPLHTAQKSCFAGAAQIVPDARGKFCHSGQEWAGWPWLFRGNLTGSVHSAPAMGQRSPSETRSAVRCPVPQTSALFRCLHFGKSRAPG